ncbi:MAG TPA: class I SAM-dependent methyltransferase [Myxococcota bacterium]|nr:class I SAM-dependent methyltransferase [Myxococcota bacterium]
MDDATALALNAINLALYRDRAAEWSAVRTRPWRGFARVAGELASLPGERLRVLDVGCGNGRFLRTLDEALGARRDALVYTGVDASAPLLERASEDAPGCARFIQADFVATPVENAIAPGPFELVALFGVLHVVPGRARRRALLAAAAEQVGPGGLLALSRWRFDEFDARRTRIVPWERYNAQAAAPIDLRQLEPGDHLLSFGAHGALRYGHAIDADELGALLAGLSLEPLADWCDDGRDASENHYMVLRRLP